MCSEEKKQITCNITSSTACNESDVLKANAASLHHWAEAPIKIARMTLTIKRDGNWSSFQLANSALPLSVTSSAIAPSARMSHDVAKQCQLIAEEEA